MRNYKFMPLSKIRAVEPEMRKKKVSVVARSPGGFLPAYKRAGGSPSKLNRARIRKRQGFIARHMAQYKNNPTRRRQLALNAWAYQPPQRPRKAR